MTGRGGSLGHLEEGRKSPRQSSGGGNGGRKNDNIRANGPGPTRRPPYRNPAAVGWWYSTWVSCCGFICFIIFAIVAAVALGVALGNSTRWMIDPVTENLIPKSEDADVEIRSGNDLIIHDSILHSGSDVLATKDESFTPVLPIGPTGPRFVFGDQAVTYTSIQADFAIGFRLGTSSILMPSGILLGEPDLKVLIEPFGVHVASVLVPFFGIFVPSDQRIKREVEDVDGAEALSNVMNLKPRTYLYEDFWHQARTASGAGRGEGEDSDHWGSSVPKIRGFVAQEVEMVLPNSVEEKTMKLNGLTVDDFKTLRKEDIITETVAAIQELTHAKVIDEASHVFERYRNDDPFEAKLPHGTPSPSSSNIPSEVSRIPECLNDNRGGDNSKRSIASCVCKELMTFCGLPGSANLNLCDADRHTGLYDSCIFVK